MKKIVFEPLHNEYITIKLYATDLDTFEWYRKDMLSEEQNFERWDILHSVLLNWLLNRQNFKYVMAFYGEDTTAKQKSWLDKCIRLTNNLPDLLMIEQKKRYVIDYGRYQIILIGKFDWLYVNNGKPTIVDIKTAMNDNIDYENKIQLKVYWFLHWIPNIEYWIFTKHQQPQFKKIEFQLDLDKNKKEVALKIIEYIENTYWYVHKGIKENLVYYNSHQWESQ